MAQRVKILLTDDMDGTEADETVRFGLDGGQYEIDLSSQNAAILRDTIRPYVGKARRVRKSAPRAAGASRSPETKKIRAWAKENGYEVSDRGRVEKHIKDAYYEAMKNS